MPFTSCPLPRRNIYRLKRFAFPTIRLSFREKTRFPVWFRPGGAVPPPRVLSFSTAKQSTGGRSDKGAACVPRSPCIRPDKSALGRGWGAWGEGEHLPRRRRGSPSPQTGRARQATQEPYGHRQQSYTSRAGGDQKAARRAVSVATKEATDIDSKARGSPSPQSNYPGPYLTTARGLLPEAGPMMPSCSSCSMMRAARLKPILKRRCTSEMEALPCSVTKACTAG